jgi:hypothetical protein
MNVTLTQAQIRSILKALPADHPERSRLEMLVQESSTLRVLYEVGLAKGADQKIQEHFARWADRSDEVYPSAADAKEARPDCFEEVCTQWGRAGYLSRQYRLADGRTVQSQGCWWDVPEPGGSRVCYYFA